MAVLAYTTESARKDAGDQVNLPPLNKELAAPFKFSLPFFCQSIMIFKIEHAKYGNTASCKPELGSLLSLAACHELARTSESFVLRRCLHWFQKFHRPDWRPPF